MHKGFLQTAFILAAITVALGAFGAHGLDGRITERALKTFETAVRYQFFHVIGLAVAGMLFREFPNKWVRFAGICFITGIVFFSGSLYLFTWAAVSGTGGFRWAGPITPLGGLFFIIGWICLAAATRYRAK